MKNTCTCFIAANLPLSLTTVIPMAESDASVGDHDFRKQPQRIPGYKDPAGKVYGPCQLPQTPETESGQNLIWVNGKQLIKIDHAANIHRYALDTLAIPATSAA